MSHRHLSHLFGLFPGHSITLEKNPDLCKAAENSIYKRGKCEDQCRDALLRFFLIFFLVVL